MTVYARAQLITFFETGDVPQGSDYANLIDSCLNMSDTNEQQIASKFNAPEVISSRISAGNINVVGTLSAATLVMDEIYTSAIYLDTSAQRTGIYRASANVVGIVAGGQSVMFVDSGGVGIGGDAQSSTNILTVYGRQQNIGDIAISAGSLYIATSGPFGDTMQIGIGSSNNALITSNRSLYVTNVLDTSFKYDQVSSPILTINGASSTVSAHNNLRQSTAIISAAGTTQGTAAVASAAICRVKGVVDGSTTGIRLQPNKAGWVQYVYNDSVSANLWPCSDGGYINALASNAAFGMAANTLYTVIHIAASSYAVK